MKLSLQLRLIITMLLTLCIGLYVAWDYFHSGIPTHYIIHDENLPGIPNWLGVLVFPFFTWLLLYRIHQRIDLTEEGVVSENMLSVILRFLLSMGIAISIAILFTLEIDLIAYIMGAIFILAFVFPLYKSEFLLGWVVGSAFTFGAMIPIVFGSLFILIFFVFYKVARKVIGYVKIRSR